MFLIKYSIEFGIIWALTTGGNSWDQGNSMHVDNNGSIYIAGTGGGYNEL